MRVPRFGLSPLSADFVDLERFPEFAHAATHRLTAYPGDAFYIPDGWWHLLRSRPGRNVAIAIEFHPFVGASGELERHWPPELVQRYHWEGIFWAEQVCMRTWHATRCTVHVRMRARRTCILSCAHGTCAARVLLTGRDHVRHARAARTIHLPEPAHAAPHTVCELRGGEHPPLPARVARQALKGATSQRFDRARRATSP